ncbi:MAG: ABC transporter permease, partial [Bryobacteraceae bacterium]
MPNPLDGFWQDTRYALRALRRSPGFTAVALSSLALGIGANTAVFSLINTLMLRMLPIPEPQQLVELLNQYPGDPPLNVFSRQSYEYFRDRNRVFSGIAGLAPARFNVRGEGLDPEAVDGEAVAGNFFQMLEVKPAIGRLIGPQDSAVAVVSWSYWRNKFNLNPAILGKRIVVEDAPMTIVGVTEREFSGVHVGFRPDIWVPVAGRPGPLQLIARLKRGVSITQARAEMAVLFRWTLAERAGASKDPAMRQLRFTVEPAAAGLSTGLRDLFAKPLLALMAVVGLLLLIACTNLANMLRARGAGRRHEMAVRVALGAGRFRLMRQVLTESVLLSGAGALLGISLAYFGAGALVRIMMSGRPQIGPRIDIQVQPDTQVLLFTGGIALLTGLLFGLAPAWNAFA